jgi:hypothetical protein
MEDFIALIRGLRSQCNPRQHFSGPLRRKPPENKSS